MSVERLRFKDENGNTYPDWQYHKLSSHGEGYSGISGLDKNYFNTNKDNAIYITYMDVFSKNVISDPSGTFLNVNENQNIVKYGDVLFTTSSETREEVGISCLYLGDKPTYLNSFCFGWSSNWERNHYFMSYLFNSTPIRRKIIKLGQGSTRFNISKNKLLNLPLNIPTIKEQEKIGNFLLLFDRLIEKLETKMRLLKELKKGYLQQMFPAIGEKVPKIRFAGFDEDWKIVILNQFGKFERGKFYGKSHVDEVGEKIILYGDLYTKYNEQIIKVRSFTSYKISNPKYGLKGDLLFPSSTTVDAKSLISPSAMLDDKSLIGGDIVRFRSKAINALYLAYYFNGPLKTKMAKLSQGTTIIHIYTREIQNFKFKSSMNLQEQEKIGNFFKALDSITEKHEKELDAIEQLKRGYMQRLFA